MGVTGQNVDGAVEDVSFGTTIVTIDGSEVAIEAGRQALAVCDAGARVIAVTVWGSLPSGETYGVTPDTSPQRAREALALATAELERCGPTGGAIDAVVLRGFAPSLITELAKRQSAALVSVGMRHTGRARGFWVGSLATELLHGAPCSVFAGRIMQRPGTGEIVVGVDGSSASERALFAARKIAHRRGRQLRVVAATGGRPIDLDSVRSIAGDDTLLIDTGPPVDVLADVTTNADLLVVGSRGLHGVRSLGSVSERVAHTAPCSTLVVR